MTDTAAGQVRGLSLAFAVLVFLSAVPADAGGISRPGIPTNVSVTGTPQGYRIAWTNPTTQADGTLLNDLAGVQIRRNGFPLVSVTGVPGEMRTYLDASYPPGVVRYELAAYDTERPIQFSDFTEPLFTPSEQPRLVVDFESLEAGVVPGAPPATISLNVRNGGPVELTFAFEEEIPWLTITPSQGSLGAFGEQAVSARFDASSLERGIHEGTVVLRTNDQRHFESSLIARFTVGFPSLRLEPESVERRYPALSENASIDLNLANAGDVPLIFTLSSPVSWAVVPPGPNVVNPGTAGTVRMDLSPGFLDPGIYTTSITIHSNDPSRPVVMLPVRMEILRSPPRLVHSPDSFRFTRSTGDVTAKAALDLRNDGAEALDVTLAENAVWLLLSQVSARIPAKSSLVIQLTIDSGRVPVGEYSETLRLATNDPENPDRALTIGLTVTPSRARIVLDVDAVEFDNTVWPRQSSRTIHVTNTGESRLLADVRDDEDWLESSGATLALEPGTSSDVVITLLTSSLAEGVHTSNIRFITNVLGSEEILVPVTARIVEASLETDAVTLDVEASWHGESVAGDLDIRNSGRGRLEITPVSGATPAWILAPAEIVVEPERTGTLSFLASPGGLDVGTYTAVIGFRTNDRNRPRVDVTVSFAVRPVPPGLTTSGPISVTRAEDAPPVVERLVLGNTGSDPLDFRIEDNVTWLLASPGAGIVPPGGTVRIDLNTAAAGLEPGSHVAELTVTTNDPANPVRLVPVGLNVTPRELEIDTDRIGVREIGFACFSDRANSGFVELTSFRSGEFYSELLGIRFEDRHGNLTLERKTILPTLPGHIPWLPGETFLLAGTGFENATGIRPDLVLPGGLDPEGGTITVFEDGSPPEILQRVFYGALGGGFAPPVGRSLNRDEPGQWPGGAATPRNAAGNTGGGFSCGGCPANTLRSGRDQITTTAATSFYPTPDVNPNPSASASYNHPRGTMSISARTFASATLNDSYHLVGGAGSPVSFEAVLHLRTNIQTFGMYTGAQLHASFRRDDELAATYYRSGYSDDTPENADMMIPIDLAPDRSFTLTTFASAEGELHGGIGSVSGQLEFRGLPPGVRVESCQGFVTAPPSVVVLRALKAVAGADAMHVVWSDAGPPRLATVLRRSDPGSWSAAGVAEVELNGWARYDDRDIEPGGTYAYRLMNTDRTYGGTIEAAVPAQRVYALSASFPTPLRGDPRILVTLPDAGPARMEVFDVAGRPRSRFDLEGKGPGSIFVNLEEREPLPSGVYFLRLEHGDENMTSRVVLVR